ncbi:MAG: Alginate lyase precursor [Fibrobacterota bacterium]|jgi:hypothetical protein
MNPVMVLLFATSTLVGVCSSAALPVPAKVIDLSKWHETLPIDSKGGTAGTADQINQPELATFQSDPWFRTVYDTTEKDTGVALRAFAGGAKTSSNTIFSRSELRERNPDYSNTAWSWNDGKVHVLRIRESIAFLPKVHPHTSAVQIHDESDDVFMLKAEGTNPGGISTKAVLNAYFDNSSVKRTVDAAYELGKAFDLEVVQHGSGISVRYNGKLVVDSFAAFPKTTRKANYFKAGCYIQTNISKYGEDSAAFAEVRIFSLSTTHGNPATTDVKPGRVFSGSAPVDLYSSDGRFERRLDPEQLRRLRTSGLEGIRAGVHLLRSSGMTGTVVVP